MTSLAVLKADIMYRLQTLAFGVQDDDQHRMFKPGEMWWVSSLGDDWRQKYPEAQHICELLGISISDMSKAFGKRWTGNQSTPFNLFRHRKLGNVNFTTVQMINEFSDYGSGSLAPHYDERKGNYNSVASKQLHSTALRRLEKQICTSSDLKRSEFIEKANELMKPSPTATKKKPAPATAKTKKKPAPATAKTVTKSITTTVSPASPTQVIPPIASQDAPPADAILIPTEDAPPEAITPNGLVNDNQTEISLPEILTYVKSLRKDKEKCVQEDVRKQSSNIAYELVTILKDSDDRVFLRSDRAGGSFWRKEVNSRGGGSERSIRRVSKDIREVQTKRVSKMSNAARQKTLTKVNQVVARYKRFKRDLIVLDRDDHLSLLSAGGMTDRQMLAFGRRFAKLTGVVFHNSGNTLAKSTANLVPDCTISKVKVAIKGQEVERQSLQVDRLTDVISHRIVSLYENKVLKKSSDMTLLDDDTLIIESRNNR
jgi:antitoxin component of RelBE/YafQ-DinJ toxin-antitoxin module